MNYTLWEDSEGNVHEISEMSTKYIKVVLNALRIQIIRFIQKNLQKRIKHKIYLAHGGVMKMLRIFWMHLNQN